MEVSIGKIVSLVIALGYAALMFWRAGVAGLKWSVTLLFPLALIWFAEQIGGLTGYFKSGYVNVQTPSVIVSGMGWFFLVGLPVVLYVIR